MESKLTIEDLSKVFHLTIRDAAKELGVCATVLKQTCRELGVRRWPFRRLVSLEKQINILTELSTECPEDEAIRPKLTKAKWLRDHIRAGEEVDDFDCGSVKVNGISQRKRAKNSPTTPPPAPQSPTPPETDSPYVANRPELPPQLSFLPENSQGYYFFATLEQVYDYQQIHGIGPIYEVQLSPELASLYERTHSPPEVQPITPAAPTLYVFPPATYYPSGADPTSSQAPRTIPVLPPEIFPLQSAIQPVCAIPARPARRRSVRQSKPS